MVVEGEGKLRELRMGFLLLLACVAWYISPFLYVPMSPSVKHSCLMVAFGKGYPWELMSNCRGICKNRETEE